MVSFVQSDKATWRGWGAGLIAISAFLILLTTVRGDVVSLLTSIAVFLVLTLPGHCLVFPFYYKQRRTIDGLIWGSVAGISASSLIISVIVCAMGWNVIAIVLVTILLPSVLLAILVKNCRRFPTILNQRYYVDILLIACSVILLSMYYPFHNLGMYLNDKYIYSWLFGHDFINRMVHVVSLSQSIPLTSYHYSGEYLSYYWLGYVFPAFLINVPLVKMSTQQILQMTCIMYSILFVLSLWMFLLKLTENRKYLAMMLLFSLVSYSFMDIYLFVLWLQEWFLHSVGGPVIFGISVSSFSGLSHTFFRFFLVEPQAVLAICVLFMILDLANHDDRYTHALSGIMIGVLFGIEATMGIIVAVSYALHAIIRVSVKGSRSSDLIKSYTITGIFTLGLYAVLFGIKMYSLGVGKGALVLNPNPLAGYAGVGYLLVEYGPALLFGLAGLAKIFREKAMPSQGILLLSSLLLISLFFAFFVANPTEVYFGLLKAGRVIPVCLLGLSAFFFSYHIFTKKMAVIVISTIIVAAPGLICDIYFASNVNNRKATYITRSDFDACNWIKDNLPNKVIVQAEPNYPGVDAYYEPDYHYSIIPVFAERATAIGEWKVSSQEHGQSARVAERFRDVRDMYLTHDVGRCAEILRAYKIDFIYVGRLERSIYNEGANKFGIYTDIFKSVYSKDGTEIYRFLNNYTGG